MLLLKRTSFLFLSIYVVIFGLALLRVHLRIQTTLIGYEIGRLKNREAVMLEQRSRLQVDIAKLTNKNHLQTIVDNESGEKHDPLKSLASRLSESETRSF